MNTIIETFPFWTVETTEHCEKYKIDVSSSVFFTHLKKIATLYSKPHFYKQKNYLKNDLILSSKEGNDCRVIQNTKTQTEVVDGMFKMTTTQKKLPYHAFPCTLQFNQIYYCGKLVFKLHSRLSLIFEQRYIDGENIYLIYISYNHDKNVESNNINNLTKQIIDQLRE